MGQTGKKTNGDALGNIVGIEIGSLSGPTEPHDHTNDNSHHKLGGSQKPMGRELIGSSLVVDIVERVSCVPKGNEGDLSIIPVVDRRVRERQRIFR